MGIIKNKKTDAIASGMDFENIDLRNFMILWLVVLFALLI